MQDGYRWRGGIWWGSLLKNCMLMDEYPASFMIVYVFVQSGRGCVTGLFFQGIRTFALILNVRFVSISKEDLLFNPTTSLILAADPNQSNR